VDPSEWLARLPAWLREPLRRPKAVVGVVVALAAVAAVAVFALRTPTGPVPKLTLPRAEAEPSVAATPGSAGGAAAAAAAAPTGLITVHVAGAVVSPGIYGLPAGARVADAVTAAGGPLADAEPDRLNLAARVSDGDRVAVPRKGDPAANGAGTDAPAGAPGATAPAGPLDLNTATVEQLDTLPGVGPATAQAIVTYRTRHGRFRSVTELLEVPGIGPTKLEAVRPLVRV
jgi:competence protein ComEA